MTSQNPSPPSATEKNLSRETYLPRRIPSTSNPPIFTVRIPSRLNSSRSDSICAARGLAVSMNSLRRTRIKQIVSARSAAKLASAIGERYVCLAKGPAMSTARLLPDLLVVQTGTAARDLVAKHGDYPDWFEEALGAKLRLVRAHEGERLADLPAHTKGIIVTGSPLSLTAPVPWMDELGERLLRLGAAGPPILGVCFGYQLLGRASGSRGVRNPNSPQNRARSGPTT